MTSARKHLLDLILEADAYDRPPPELQPLCLEAARELFREQGRG